MSPVVLQLKVEDGRALVDLQANSIYWIEEILEVHPLPPDDWSERLRARAESYVNAHFLLQADGRPLAGRLVSARFIQRPWQILENGTVRLRLQYPPVARSAALSGAATFYYEYRDERIAMKKEPIEATDRLFVTKLRIDGERRQELDLTPARHDFSFPAGDVERAMAQKSSESLLAGVERALDPGFAALMLLAAWLVDDFLFFAALGATGACAGFAAELGFNAAAPAGFSLVVAGALGLLPDEPRRKVRGAALALAALVCGAVWSRGCASVLPDAAPRVIYYALFLAGCGISSAALALAGRAALSAHRRALVHFSEARAGEIEGRRRWILALLVCLVGLYQTFGQSLR